MPNELVRFNKITLGFAIFFFLCTFPYWFLTSDSPLSIVNIVLSKVDRSNIYNHPDLQQQMPWLVFYVHLVLTSLGLLIYYRSGFQRWVGMTVSYRYLAPFFLQGNNKARTWILIFKIVMGLLIVLLAYDIFTESVRALYIPRFSFTLLILIFFVSTTGWNVSYPEPVSIPKYEGSMDNRNKVMLVKLSDDQVAYVQDMQNREQWLLKERRDDVDLSFTEAYIFNLNKFKHHISSVKVVESAVGSVECKIELEPLVNMMPQLLHFKQLQNLNGLSADQQIQSLVFLALDQSTIKKEIEEKFDSLNTWFLTNPRASVDEWNTKYQKIYQDISSSRLDASISRSIQDSVDNLLGGQGIFKVTSTISRDTAREYFLNKIAQHKEDSLKAGQQAMIQERQIVIAAISERLKHPGLPVKMAKELLSMISELNNHEPTEPHISNIKDRFQNMLRNEAETKDNPELIKAAKEITDVILIAKKQNYDRDETKELIAGSTKFFEEQQLSVEHFFDKLFEKGEAEKEERTEDAYRMLVRDTLKAITKPALSSDGIK